MFGEETWLDGRVFSRQEAWLDLVQLARYEQPDLGTFAISQRGLAQRWNWSKSSVVRFLEKLEVAKQLAPQGRGVWLLVNYAKYQLGEPPAEPKPKKYPEKRENTGFEGEFGRIWSDYPKKVARGAALKAYCARRHEGTAFQALHQATLQYAASREGEPARFTMHASTFFGPDERWKEEWKASPNSKYEGPMQDLQALYRDDIAAAKREAEEPQTQETEDPYEFLENL